MLVIATGVVIAGGLYGIGTGGPDTTDGPGLAGAGRQAVPGPSGIGPSGTAPNAARPTPLPGVASCTSTATPTPVHPAASIPGGPALPAGWIWYQHPTGFRVAAPAGWLATVDATGICLHEPGGVRMLGVDRWKPQAAVPFWTRAEAKLTAVTRPVAYQRIAIDPVDYFTSSSADWECGYTEPSGRLHSLTRAFQVSAQRGYVLGWRTREFDWQTNLDNFRLITASFVPPRV